ncbi:rubrerythrin [Anaeromicropila herbilytica]|uniref:Rubrerythrin n=1 Tax=Anaeromicropila herbilytica TaxID=2785025 RepID=A0A7R7IEI1_9FIRM|nr:rubrerythrin family protein [Anaeromicropila herbilytica]BCN32031.1 rubrerythrin [Anaeromicropila herbilytica]
MSVSLKESKTKENLLRAFAGESQAANRYTFAANVAKNNKLHLVEEVFLFTANQERAHAKVFFDHLKEVAGENIYIDGNFPVDISDDIVSLLNKAKHNEFEEFEDAYPNFAKIAKEEGFAQIAASFELIAKVEKTHGERFGFYAKMLEENKLYQSDTSGIWMCLNCGHIVTGNKAPEICPVCQYDQGYFVPIEYAPYSDKAMLGL